VDIGYPQAQEFQVITTGSYAAIVNGPEGLQRDVYSCQSTHGNSGGPVLDSDNKVIGVTVRNSKEYSQLTLGIRLQDIKDFLNKYCKLTNTDYSFCNQ
jgi:V8-like Glu-specific endopeptidase